MKTKQIQQLVGSWTNQQKVAFLKSWACIFLLGLVFPTATFADYMPFNGAAVARSIAEIRIGEDGVHVKLEVFIEDIGIFEALVPDDWVSGASESRPGASERLAAFSQDGLSIRTDEGRFLPIELALVEPRMRIDRASPWAGVTDPISGRVFPKPPDDKRVVYAELFYDFEGKRPDAITIIPPFDEDGNASVSIGMVVFDRAVPATKFSFLSSYARLEIDWSDPWYSSFDSPNLKRHHRSAAMTYLYVEPREVRHETLIRVRDLLDFVDLELGDGPGMDADAQKRVKIAARTFLAGRNPVTIDGITVVPEAGRASFLSLTDTGLQIVEQGGPLDPLSTFVGVILSFPVPSIPDSVTITWDMFTPRIQNVPATATDPAGPFLSGATPQSPLIGWKNFLRTYQEPNVIPVVEPYYGVVLVPLATLTFGLATICLLIVAGMRRGYTRVILIGCSIACVVAAVSTKQIAVAEVSNPLSGLPDPEISASIFSELLGGINAANFEMDHAVRTQKLHTIVSAGSSGAVVTELDRALAIEVAGGGLAKVNAIEDVTMTEITQLSGHTGFQSLAEWTARASAGHWGHNHQRNLRYRALVEVQREAGTWKLAGITVIDTRDTD